MCKPLLCTDGQLLRWHAMHGCLQSAADGVLSVLPPLLVPTPGVNVTVAFGGLSANTRYQLYLIATLVTGSAWAMARRVCLSVGVTP